MRHPIYYNIQFYTDKYYDLYKYVHIIYSFETPWVVIVLRIILWCKVYPFILIIIRI